MHGVENSSGRAFFPCGQCPASTQLHTHIFPSFYRFLSLDFSTAILDEQQRKHHKTISTSFLIIFKCAFSSVSKYVGLFLKQRHHEKIAGLGKDCCAVRSLVGGFLAPAPLASAITVSTGDSWTPKGSDNPIQLNPFQLFLRPIFRPGLGAAAPINSTFSLAVDNAWFSRVTQRELMTAVVAARLRSNYKFPSRD